MDLCRHQYPKGSLIHRQLGAGDETAVSRTIDALPIDHIRSSERFFLNSWCESEDVTVVWPIRVVTRNAESIRILYRCPPRTRLDAKASKMNRKTTIQRTSTSIALTFVAGLCLVSATGCQVSLNGQTLPSPYYLQDDVQYFPSGPEFKLPNEAAALKAAKAEEKLNRK